MLIVTDIVHSFGEDNVLDGVSLSLAPGELGCLLGDSGSGKTTLLRCIAGFERPLSGKIEIDGRVQSDAQCFRAPEQREVGMVFQDFALLPNLSVESNVRLALHDRPADGQRQAVNEMLELVDLAGLADRMPHQLSGGQQQRVALARALVRRPKLLLLDEPFSSLDATLREKLGADVRALLKRLDITALFVSHDRSEAFSLADKIGVVRKGQLAQWGRSYDLYHKPVSREVAAFVGGGAWLPGTCIAIDAVETALGVMPAVLPPGVAVGSSVDVLLRPDDVVHDDEAPRKAEVVARHFRGAMFLYELRIDNGTLVESLVPSHHDHAIGELIGVRLDTQHVVVFARD
ncbi:MAG: ABC transporter ATP-binding protein [Pseudomonadota bacterium]